MSEEIKQVQIAKNLGIDQELLFEKLIEWAEILPIKIKGNLIIVEKIVEKRK